jgi:NADH-quinone oxidoreductase subunit L
MVTAGVFLICRAHPFFDASHSAMTVVAWVGAVTALVAGTIAVLQPDIKRVLAYSTISQLGYMFLALGTGAYAAAVFFVLMHAFYKACLFLGAGSVIHGDGENQDMRIMGALRRFLPYTAGAMVVAWLAIAGAPPFDGFWAKDGVLEAAYVRHDFGIWAVGVVAAVMTGLYMTRLILLTFFGNARWRASDAPAVPAVSGGSDDDPAPGEESEAELGYDPDFLPTVVYGEPPRASRLDGHEPHESPALMVLPIVTLALLSIVGGILNIPLRGGTHLDSWLEPVFRTAPITESFAGAAALSATALAFGVVGIVVAFLFYRRGLASPADDPLQERLGVVGDVVGHGYYYDEGISKAVDGPVRAFATFLDRDVDQRVIDGAVNGTGHLVRRAAEGLRHAQDGLVRRYAIGIALGAAALLLFFLAYAGR